MEIQHVLKSRMHAHKLTSAAVAELGTRRLNEDDDGSSYKLTPNHVRSALRHANVGGSRVGTLIDAIDTYMPPQQSGIACHARPGSEERIAEYAARFERGDAIFDDADTGVPLPQFEDERGRTLKSELAAS
jgi:hypothetical protein